MKHVDNNALVNVRTGGNGTGTHPIYIPFDHREVNEIIIFILEFRRHFIINY